MREGKVRLAWLWEGREIDVRVGRRVQNARASLGLPRGVSPTGGQR